MAVTLRGLLAGAAAGGGLVVAWWLMPRSYRTPLVEARGEHVFGAWLKIASDGVVTVAVPQLEMGQGINVSCGGDRRAKQQPGSPRAGNGQKAETQPTQHQMCTDCRKVPPPGETAGTVQDPGLKSIGQRRDPEHSIAEKLVR